MTKVVEAINEFELTPEDCTLFMAGGILNCPDWQSEMIKKLDGLKKLVIYNPRRTIFPMDDPNASEEQILWEYYKLIESDMILYWFSRGSLNPISLYELGLHGNSQLKTKIFIGIDPEYERKLDVVIQTRLSRPEIEIVYSLDELADQIIKYYNA